MYTGDEKEKGKTLNQIHLILFYVNFSEWI